MHLRSPFARFRADQPADAVLSFAGILEEEYSALHPDEPRADPSVRPSFVADDIADLAGFARALLKAQQRGELGPASQAWVDHPPAPRTSPMSDVGEYVIRGQDALSDLLRATLSREDAARSTDESRVRSLLADRLTALVADPGLPRQKAFATVRALVDAFDDGTFKTLAPTSYNRLLIECAFGPFLRTSEDRRLVEVLSRIREKRHAALALSGGGIRSASFSMGVVQGLARRGLLSQFHYLSTVSGGGYTGSWLSAWMARAGADQVHEHLRGAHTTKPDAEPAPLRHIRSFSYYLNPSFGLLSTDTWTLIATIARNILLVWLVMLPVIAAGLMLPRFFVAGPMMTLANWNDFGTDPADLVAFLLTTGTILAIVAISFVQRHLYTYSGRIEVGAVDPKEQRLATVQQFISLCLVPLVIAMAELSQAWQMISEMIRLSPTDPAVIEHALTRRDWADWLIRQNPSSIEGVAASVASGVAFWSFVYVAAWAVSTIGRKPRWRAAWLSALSGAIAGAIGGFASAKIFGVLSWQQPPEAFATFSVPLSLGGLLLAKQLMVGFASHDMTDAEREANARFSAWLLVAIFGWISIVGLALYGPILLRKVVTSTENLIAVSGVTGVIASVLAASSRSGAVDGAPSRGLTNTLRQTAIALATPVFAATVVVLVSVMNGVMLTAVCHQQASWCPDGDPSGAHLAPTVAGKIFAPADYASPHLVIGAFFLLLGIGYFFARRIDTNKFSLHAMYRARLVRTFLGASKPPGERQPNPFTGFDETDDMPMADLWPARAASKAESGLRPPLHLLNLTLNTVAGTNLATQNRKATSFTVSSLHAGSADIGFRPTSTPADRKDRASAKLYGGRRGISLGTAMAVSGAAASPNAGYHSSPTVTFLMTLFNARLGWWLGNPGPAGRKTYTREEPTLALVPILEEMFGRTTDHSAYVYLSDGGHFENLGIYEMVRRRCRLIVVSDAGCDPKCAFDDLGGAIRKIRIDFGVPIDFPESGIPISARGAHTRPVESTYWSVARIRYSQVDGGDSASDGLLLYIKPAFYGTEPADVYNYATSTPTFPHESTGNQFFGETQFESYRALGAYIVDQMCEKEFGVAAGSNELIPRATMDDWFRSHLEEPMIESGGRREAVATVV